MNKILHLLSVLLFSILLTHGQASALDCPKMPEQIKKDWETEVNAEVVKIGPVKGAELKTRTKNATKDLLGKLPDSGRVYLEQMMYSAYCSALRDDKTIRESEKGNLLKQYNREVRKAITTPAASTPKPIVRTPKASIQGKDQPQEKKPSSAPTENPVEGAQSTTEKKKNQATANSENKRSVQIEAENEPQKGKEVKRKSLSQPPSLHDLFDRDFSSLFTFSASRQIGIKSDNLYDIGQSGVDTKLPPSGPNISFKAVVGPGRPSNYREETPEEHLTIHEQEYQDYKSRTKFLSYYIPFSRHSYRIIEYLSDAYKKTMSDFESIGGLRVRYSAESSDLTDSKDLTFSGRIYVYHEDDFTLQELASLEQLYKSKSLSVVFRGIVYLQTSSEWVMGDAH